MYFGLTHAHSGLRWIVLLLLILAIGAAYGSLRREGPFSPTVRRLALFSLIFTHIQLILGLVLYFISPKVSFASGVMSNPITRFYTVEHFSIMLLAIVIITVGYSRAKRREDDGAKLRSIAIFYGIGLILILLSIPWPFRELGAGWF